MVNHVETLLLNATEPQLRNLGFARGEPWYVDPEFSSPVQVPDGVRPVVDALFDGIDEDDIRARPRRVMSAVSLAMEGEIRPFVDILDARRTVLYRSPGSVRGLYMASRESDSGFENGVVDACAVSSGLFGRTGITRVDAVSGMLASIARSCRERVVRFGAVITLLAYQLESARLGRSV